MRRREFLVVVGSVAAWPAVARAQQSSKPVVGWLGLTSESGEAEMIAAFRRGLKEAGFDEGRNVSIEFRFAEGDVSRLPTLATELAGKTALLVTGTTAASVAAKRATSTLPIVFVIGADPIKSGLVDRLNANISGISFFTNQMEGKRLGLLHEVAPKADPVAVLLNPNNPFFEAQRQDLENASRELGVKSTSNGLATTARSHLHSRHSNKPMLARC